MLTWLGIVTIGALLGLILFRVTSVVVALTLVPIATALLAGFGGDVGGFAIDGIRGIAPIAALLAFAVLYFGVMNDAGLFEPFIRRLLGLMHRDPVRIAIGTAAVASVAHLDGAGASTFMVTVPALLPLYQRLGMSPLTLTCHRAGGRLDEHAAVGRADQPRRGGAAGQHRRTLRAGARAVRRRDGGGVRVRGAPRTPRAGAAGDGRSVRAA
jgi:hypothetical protein